MQRVARRSLERNETERNVRFDEAKRWRSRTIILSRIHEAGGQSCSSSPSWSRQIHMNYNVMLKEYLQKDLAGVTYVTYERLILEPYLDMSSCWLRDLFFNILIVLLQHCMSASGGVTEKGYPIYIYIYIYKYIYIYRVREPTDPWVCPLLL